jgi:hypothetical protein
MRRQRSSNAASTSPRARASILSLASRLGRAPLLGRGRWLVRDARRRARARPAVAPAREEDPPLLPRQNFPLNLPPNRRLCSTVGGRIVEGWTAHCCVVSAARSRAATMTNLARSSLALVLPALFGAAKSCALVKFFMICPRWSPSRQPTTNQIVLLITAISWHLWLAAGGKLSALRTILIAAACRDRARRLVCDCALISPVVACTRTKSLTRLNAKPVQSQTDHPLG